MGFSLKRALAGAVAGAADSAAEVFDAQLKEAERQREAEAAAVRRKQEQDYADTLLEARERRKEEHLTRRESEKRDLYAKTVADETAALQEKGIKIGSAEGQDAIGAAFLKKGYPEFGNTYIDNAQKAREATDRSDLKKIEMQNMLETRRATRDATLATREATRASKRSEDFKVADKAYNDTLNDYEVTTFNDDGKPAGKDATIKNWIRASTFDEARTNPYEAMRAASQLGELVNEIRAEKPKMSLFAVTQEAERRAREQVVANQAATAAMKRTQAGETVDFSSPRGAPPPSQSQPAQPRSSRPTTRTPGILEGGGGASDPMSLTGRLPGLPAGEPMNPNAFKVG